MLAKVKFCGMTRPQDAALAAEIGASYIGVVFADGPRRVSPSQARGILDGAGETRGVKRVGVFGTNDPSEIARISEEARLDVVQLHADPTTTDVRSIRRAFGGEVWAAIRIAGTHIPPDAEMLFDTADAIVLGACEVCNIKPGRVGGYLEAVRIHDVCRSHGVPVWCGGMLETGLGRAANVALAALPGFTLPGDVSASDRYFHRDITEPHHRPGRYRSRRIRPGRRPP